MSTAAQKLARKRYLCFAIETVASNYMQVIQVKPHTYHKTCKNTKGCAINIKLEYGMLTFIGCYILQLCWATE